MRNASMTIGRDEPEENGRGGAQIVSAKLRLIGSARNGGVQFFAPAEMVAAGATTLFAPYRSKARVRRGREEEACLLHDLRRLSFDAAKRSGRLESTLGPRPQPSECPCGSTWVPSIDISELPAGERWGDLVCRGPGKGNPLDIKTLLGATGRLPDVIDRLDYFRTALCRQPVPGSAGMRPTVVPEEYTSHRHASDGINIPALDATGRPRELAAEIDFENLLGAASDPLESASESQKQKARDQLSSIPTTALTTLGQAARAWALGDKKLAFAKLREHLTNVVEALTPAKRRAFEDTAGELVFEYNKRTELSFKFDSRIRDGNADEYMGFLILEASPFKTTRIARFANLTSNLGFDVMEIPSESDAYGGFLGVEMTFPLRKPTITSAMPTLSFAARARVMRNAGDEFLGQVKIAIPVADGVTFPLSLTVSNRTEILQEEETDVRGLLGFTLDTTRLAGLLRQGLVPEL